MTESVLQADAIRTDPDDLTAVWQDCPSVISDRALKLGGPVHRDTHSLRVFPFILREACAKELSLSVNSVLCNIMKSSACFFDISSPLRRAQPHFHGFFRWVWLRTPVSEPCDSQPCLSDNLLHSPVMGRRHDSQLSG